MLANRHITSSKTTVRSPPAGSLEAKQSRSLYIIHPILFTGNFHLSIFLYIREVQLPIHRFFLSPIQKVKGSLANKSFHIILFQVTKRHIFLIAYVDSWVPTQISLFIKPIIYVIIKGILQNI